MRKLACLVASAALLASGLVAVSASTATAAPYPGTVNTVCRADALNNPRVGRPARVALNVATGGNGGARGWATFSYEKKRSGFIVREWRRRYRGPGANKWAFPKRIARGRYTVRVFFNSTPGSSIYQNCRTTFTQRVRPRRRR